MTDKKALELALKRVAGLSDRIFRLEQDIKKLKDLLNVHDNWNAKVRELIGKQIQVCDRCGYVQEGTLLWTDRYNLCIEVPASEATEHTPRERIYTKGGINWIST